jgi:nucleoside-diphosphate-sugar epimerase
MLLCETLVETFRRRHGLSCLVLRPAHVYGAGDSRPGFLRTFITKALAGKPIETHVYENGIPHVDLLHVRDLVTAVCSAHTAGLEGVLHVASGHPIGTDELAHQIVRISGSESEIYHVEISSGWAQAVLDASKARLLLRWKPATSLCEGLSEMIEDARTASAH